MSKRLDQLPTAGSVANTDIMVIGNPTTGAMKKVLVSQVAPKNQQVSLTDAATVVWNFPDGNIGKVTLGGNRGLSITNAPALSCGLLLVYQDGTGGRTLSLPGAVPGDWALSEDPGAVDMIGFYYDGTTFFWSVNGGTGTVPPVVLENLTFPTFTGTLTNTSGVWTTPVGATGWAGNHGLSGKKLAAGQDGYIQFEYAASDGQFAILGFNTTNADQGYADYECGIVITSGDLGVFNAGVGTFSIYTPTPAAGYLIRIIRTGSVIKCQTSPDGSTWTDRHTFASTSTGNLYVNINIYDGSAGTAGKMYNPKGYNLS
jgi:hypothetical protein